MKLLVFDTETTGLVDFKKPVDDPCQPRIVQLACVLLDSETWRNLAIVSLLVTQDKDVPAVTSAIHGWTKEICNANGVSASYALHIFTRLWDIADIRYAYNADYDKTVLMGEMLRIDRQGEAAKLGSCKDAMKPLTDLCKLPNPKWPGKFKWPSLIEAHKFFFGDEPPEAHDALADVHSTIKILREHQTRFNKLP